jgi:hypothetical protein
MEQHQIMQNYIGKTPRPMISAAKKHFYPRQNLVGAEIGVAGGDNALSILQELPVKKLYLIDPYLPFGVGNVVWDSSVLAKVAIRKLATYPQAVWLRKPSKLAVHDIDVLDFLYIDGNHVYEAVKQDIKLYYQLMKKNGIIGGHDYTPLTEGVVKAVNEFALKTTLEKHIVFPDWWFT